MHFVCPCYIGGTYYDYDNSKLGKNNGSKLMRIAACEHDMIWRSPHHLHGRETFIPQ